MSAAVPTKIQTRAANGSVRNDATRAVQVLVTDSVMVASQVARAAIGPEPRLVQFAFSHSRKFETNDSIVGKVAIGLANSAPKPV